MRLINPRQISWLSGLLVTVAVLIGCGQKQIASGQPAPAATLKISPDLTEQARRSPLQRQRVIIQLNGGLTPTLDSMSRLVGGRIIRQLNKLGVIVIELPLGVVEILASNQAVRFVSPDRPVQASGHVVTTTGVEAARAQGTQGGLLGSLLSTPLDGRGIGIAILDSGIDQNHVVFRDDLGFSRVVASRDFTGENRTDDPFGHGTHVASLAAGNEQISNGAYGGIAPAAKIINLRILNSQGTGTTEGVLLALDWISTFHTIYNIRVVNLSVGTAAIDSYQNDPLCLAVRRLSDLGIVVVAAAGNNGKATTGQKIYGQIHSPGNEPAAITVGAANTFGSNNRGDDTVTSFSSRGPTRSYWTDADGLRHHDNLLKPDLTAPGNRLIGAAAANNYLLTAYPDLDAHVSTIANRRMMYMSGSSMAAPITAGAAALLLQANSSLTPSLLKAILMYTAQPVPGSNTFEQGAGELNVEGAIRLARLVRPDLTSFTSLGEPLLTDSMPVEQTTVNGETFSWARGIILNHTFATGAELATRYQRTYATGRILGDGVIESSSNQVIDSMTMTNGVLLASQALTSNGGNLATGSFFLDLNWLMDDGVMIDNGVMVGDGVMLGDGVMVGDGIMVGEGTLQPTSLPTGDNTACMR